MADPLPHAPLTTERIVLDAPTMADVPAIVQHANDLEVARWLSRLPHPYGEADARFFLEEVIREETVWTIALRGGAPMGTIGLMPRGDGIHEVGYWLGRRHWGQGYVTEAARAVVAYAFTQPSVVALQSAHFVGNDASARVLSKLGFVEVGRSERACRALGRTVQQIDLRLQRSAAPAT